jgi:carbon monoxide dehydrogenase subunit G
MTTSSDHPQPGGPATTVRRSVEVAAPPQRVWELVSDLPGMGAFSPENRGGRWVSGTGPQVGAVFVGSNGAGRRRWSTRSTVVRSEPGRAFAFDVSGGGLPVARWSYDVEPTAGGCRLTETWEDRRGPLLRRTAPLLTGVRDRTGFTATSIEQTLAAVKQTAEGATAG